MKVKFDKNLAAMFFLGAVCGLPLALILSTLKALLSDKGFDLATIGFFSLVTLPYTLKIFFAPIIDSCSVPFLTKILGQRKSWIVLSQMVLIIFISTLGLVTITNNISLIATFAFLVAFASASQDIVVDAYRIEIIKKEDQGLAASLYVYGYRIGMLISGAGALVLSDLIGWDAVYFMMGLFMITGIITTLFVDESRKNWQQKKYNFSVWFKESVFQPLYDFTHRKQWLVIFAFIICFKLGDAFAGNLTLPFLLELKFSKVEIATIAKSFGLFATLFGAFFGGILVKKIGINKSLWIAGFAQMMSNLSFSYLAQIGHDTNTLYFVVFIENFSGGIGDSVFVAYLSGLCNLSFSATQYAVLSSFSTIARSTFSSTAGVFAKEFGWYNFFILSTFLAIPGLIFLFLLTIKNRNDTSVSS
ncbi:MAG: AmpG family muropeptide MFS transporter [Rickettsiales bacterium]|nr:AmpG family muropeptide MFS transporter [Rickettsiales bacterium]